MTDYWVPCPRCRPLDEPLNGCALCNSWLVGKKLVPAQCAMYWVLMTGGRGHPRDPGKLVDNDYDIIYRATKLG